MKKTEQNGEGTSKRLIKSVMRGSKNKREGEIKEETGGRKPFFAKSIRGIQ